MIKKTMFTVLVCLLCTLAVKAQITKGNWMFGGSGSYSQKIIKTGYGDSKNAVFNIKPSLGFFIMDKWALGCSMSYYSYKDLKYVSYANNFSIGLFSRYYFLKTENMFNLFFQGHFDKVFYKNNAGSVNKGDGYRYGFRAGQVVFLNSIVGIELSLDYDKTVNGNESIDDVMIGVGFQIHLEKNKN